MKLCLIKASAESAFKAYKHERGGPPQSTFSIAAATPGQLTVEMHDEVLAPCKPDQINADLAVIVLPPRRQPGP